jgi:putative endonuclease
MKRFYVYILSNENDTVLYTGVTSDLKRRVYQHKEKLAAGFSKKYNLNKLVYYEVCDDAVSAIAREKQVKAGSRLKKNELIQRMNKTRRDLFPGL